jgi:hypothetical protein
MQFQEYSVSITNTIDYEMRQVNYKCRVHITLYRTTTQKGSGTFGTAIVVSIQVFAEMNIPLFCINPNKILICAEMICSWNYWKTFKFKKHVM